MVTEAILAFAFIVGLSLFGGDSGTTVILLPDESGQVGAVTVSTADDSRVLNQTYNAVTAYARDVGASGNLRTTGGAFAVYDGLLF